jgi:hypothetical protein
MPGKRVSLGKVLEELKTVIKELENTDPAWSDQEKKRAAYSARILKNVHDLVANDCTDGTQAVPN